jgi:hypothetical protein
MKISDRIDKGLRASDADMRAIMDFYLKFRNALELVREDVKSVYLSPLNADGTGCQVVVIFNGTRLDVKESYPVLGEGSPAHFIEKLARAHPGIKIPAAIAGG